MRESAERLAFRDRPEDRAQAATLVDKARGALERTHAPEPDLPAPDHAARVVDLLRARLKKGDA